MSGQLKLREIEVASSSSSGQGARSIKGWPRKVSLALVLVIAFMTTGFGATAAPRAMASWNPLDKLCTYDSMKDHPGGITEWPGLVGGAIGAGDPTSWAPDSGGTGDPISFGKKVQDQIPYAGKRAVTAYEWWGTAANQWIMVNIPDDTFKGTCFPAFKSAGNVAANLFWGIDKTIAGIGLAIFSFSMGVDSFEPFLKIVQCVISGCERGTIDKTDGTISKGDGKGGLVEGLFLEYLIPIVMLGALWMAWKGVIKRSGTEAVQGAVWMVLSSGAAIAFMINAAFWAGGMNNVITDVSKGLMQTISGSVSPGPGSMCYLPKNAEDAADRIAACSIWETFVYVPWAHGQFGSMLSRPLDSKLVSKIKSMADPVEIPGHAPTKNIVAVHMDAFTFNHDEVIKMSKGEAPDLAKKTKQYAAVVAALDTQPTAEDWAGNKWGDRLFIALITLIAMFAGAIPIIVLSFSLIVLQFGMIMLFLTAPLFLTLGIHPGFGRRIALSWVEMILGLAIKRIMTVVLISLMLAIMQAIMLASAGFIPTVIMIGAIGIGMMQYRKKILEQTSQISLGGSGNMLAGAGQGKKLGNMMSSGFAQGIGSKQAGGSFFSGLGAGILAGRAGGTPLAAYRMGGENAEKKQAKESRFAEMAEMERKEELNALLPEEIQKRRDEELREKQKQNNAMRGEWGQAGNVPAWKAWKESKGIDAPLPVNSALANELRTSGVPMRLPTEDASYMAELEQAGYTPEMVEFMTGSAADRVAFSDYLSGRVEPSAPSGGGATQMEFEFENVAPPGGGSSAPGSVAPSPGVSSQRPIRPNFDLPLPNESDTTTDMLIDPTLNSSAPAVIQPSGGNTGIGYSPRHRNLINHKRREQGLPELTLKDFEFYSRNNPGKRLTDPSIQPRGDESR